LAQVLSIKMMPPWSMAVPPWIASESAAQAEILEALLDEQAVVKS
jgi:hypothetical protein